MVKKKSKTDKQLNNFIQFYRNPQETEEKIIKKLTPKAQIFLDEIYSISKENNSVYPDQGLLLTPYDHLEYKHIQMLPQELILKTLQERIFFLELFNHPYRISQLLKTDRGKFSPPPKIKFTALENAKKTGLSLSVRDIGANIMGSNKPRESRTLRYAKGPFIKLGGQARSIFVGSSSPDVWNSSLAVATMAASHCLAGIPRNGVLAIPQRQADLAKKTFKILNHLSSLILKGRRNEKKILKMWKSNVMGTLEASTEKALKRAEILYKAGVRTFRIYSPEPGDGPINTTKALRKNFKDKIEIITSLIVDTEQAKRAEEAGSNAIIVGVGGGGRCTTGVRSGSVIGWPEIVFNLRGEISIPIIVEGGASDHIAVTLLLGASGISVSRAVAGGTIESPGGALYCTDNNGKLFKPYGGEASARTKYLENKLLPFKIPSFVEGETTKAQISYVKHVLPTLTYNLHLLTEDAILTLVFRNVSSINQLHQINPSPLRQATALDQYQRNIH